MTESYRPLHSFYTQLAAPTSAMVEEYQRRYTPLIGSVPRTRWEPRKDTPEHAAWRKEGERLAKVKRDAAIAEQEAAREAIAGATGCRRMVMELHQPVLVGNRLHCAGCEECHDMACTGPEMPYWPCGTWISTEAYPENSATLNEERAAAGLPPAAPLPPPAPLLSQPSVPPRGWSQLL